MAYTILSLERRKIPTDTTLWGNHEDIVLNEIS
jgi:hypothetical protein